MHSRSWLSVLRGRSMVVVALLCVLVLVFAAACGGDDDDDDAGDTTAVATSESSTDASATATEGDEAPIATATEVEEDASPTATEETAATPTEEAAAATPTEEEADPTATAADDDPSPTTDGTGDIDDPLADVQPIDPEALPNFTMSFTFDLTGIPDQEDSSIGVEIEQSAIDNYHMSAQLTGTGIETWLVDGTNYVDQGDGTIVELPEGTDSGLFSPSIFLQEVPPLEPELQATLEGEEEISGRDTRHYIISGENYLAQADMWAGGEASDVEGQVEVWVDIELNMMIKQLADITWTNADSTTGTFMSDLLIYDIGTTGTVEAPQ